MDRSEKGVVLGRDGLRGVLESPWASDREAVVRLDDGRRVVLAAGLLAARQDGAYDLPLGLADVESEAETSEFVVPVVEEVAEVRKRTVETGRVRVIKRVETREEVVDVPTWKEGVQVERVAVNRVLDGPAEVRREGDTTIIPLVEEVLVVEKRLVLREEIRITTRRVEERKPSKVELRRERAEVERVAPEGVRLNTSES